MPTVTQTTQKYFSQVFENTASTVTTSLANWKGWLTTAGKLYKYLSTSNV